jgi:hypothetical protein
VSTATPRPVDIVDRAIAGVRALQREKVKYRDNRNRDMLTALADVERIEGQIAADNRLIENLFAEREHSAHPERFAPDAHTTDS